jgi:hypothetical protein
MGLLLRIITPCSIVNNEYARKFFGKSKSTYFKTGLLGKYLNLNLKERGHQSECKRLAFEILTVFKCENPLFDESQVFRDPDDHRKYLRWLMMNYPSVYPQAAPENMYCPIK